MRICLGTAQLGLNYGIGNTQGKPDRQTAEAILDTAWDLGIREFDTAAQYGTSESVLNGWLSSRKRFNEVRIITKLPGLPDLTESELSAWMVSNAQDRLAVLGMDSVEAILLHRAEDLNRPGAAENLKSLVLDGLCRRIGVSAYSPQAASGVIETGLTAVQVTYNIFDRRFADSGFLDSAKANQIRIYARSPFLQGLLLMNPNDLPHHMAFARDKLFAWHRGIASLGLKSLDAALGYSLMEERIDAVVLGVDSPSQLREICKAAETPMPTEALQRLAVSLDPVEDQLIMPFMWHK